MAIMAASAADLGHQIEPTGPAAILGAVIGYTAGLVINHGTKKLGQRVSTKTISGPNRPAATRSTGPRDSDRLRLPSSFPQFRGGGGAARVR